MSPTQAITPPAAERQHLRSAGAPVSDDLLRHVAPLGWNHISLTGDYLWTHVTAPDDGFYPLNIIDEAA